MKQHIELRNPHLRPQGKQHKKQNLAVEKERMLYEQKLGNLRTKAKKETRCPRHSDLMRSSSALESTEEFCCFKEKKVLVLEGG